MRVRSLALAVLAACSAPSHPPTSVAHAPHAGATNLPSGPPLVTPGEHMSYRLALEGMDLATYDIAVGELTDVRGHKAIPVQSHAKAIGLVKFVANIDDVFTSWIDVTTGRPLLWYVDEYAVKGDDKERSDARLLDRSGNTVPIFFHVNDQPPAPEPQTVSLPDVWDYNAFMIALRTWDAPAGSTTTVEVLRSRFLWHVDLTMGKTEKITTELGEFPSRRIEGHTYKLARDGSRFPDSEARDFSLWISDDDGRVPLQITARTDYGDIKMQIVEYAPGTGTRLRD